MVHNYRRPQNFGQSRQIKTRTNEQIKVPQVRVISSSGEQLGIMNTADAIRMAREKGLDLIEVSPKPEPPVAKLTSYDKFRYQQNKLAQAQRKHQKKIEVKGIRLSARTGVHDLEFKARSADKFLSEGNKVKVELVMRGRERANSDYAFQQIQKFLALISAPRALEVPPKRMGNIISALVSPGKTPAVNPQN